MQVRNEGIDVGDDMMMLRYIASRTGEKYDYVLDLKAKPVKGDWNGLLDAILILAQNQ